MKMIYGSGITIVFVNGVGSQLLLLFWMLCVKFYWEILYIFKDNERVLLPDLEGQKRLCEEQTHKDNKEL